MQISATAQQIKAAENGRRDIALHTVSAGGFSATADAFVEDRDQGLWFLSMVGSQTALKAI